MRVQRFLTNISGFDDLIKGGIIKNSTILLSGKYGSGKTIFSLKCISNLLNLDETKVIYFSFEERKEFLFQQAEECGFDLKSFYEKGFLKIIDIGHRDIGQNTPNEVLEIINIFGADFVVFDSITNLTFLNSDNFNSRFDTQFALKKLLYNFIIRLKENIKLTSFLISQKDDIEIDTACRYFCDAVVDFDFKKLEGDNIKTICVKKMRQTEIDSQICSLEIKKNKIFVKKLL